MAITMKHEPITDPAFKGKYFVAEPYGTHGAFDVWVEKFGLFDTKEEADQALVDDCKISEHTKISVSVGYMYVRQAQPQEGYPCRRIEINTDIHEISDVSCET